MIFEFTFDDHDLGSASPKDRYRAAIQDMWWHEFVDRDKETRSRPIEDHTDTKGARPLSPALTRHPGSGISLVP
jgi:hypothetical protein